MNQRLALALPCAGPAAWRAVTLAWAAKLEQQLGEPHLAALHLLAAQEVEGAVQVRRNRGSGIGGLVQRVLGDCQWVGRGHSYIALSSSVVDVRPRSSLLSIRASRSRCTAERGCYVRLWRLPPPGCCRAILCCW